MQQAINALLLNGQLAVDTKREWLAHAVLAHKPHQEEITNINDFVWRFYISYILLNQATKVISYPISQCDDAIYIGFGKGILFLLADAHIRYYQILMEHNSSLKTVFAGPFG